MSSQTLNGGAIRQAEGKRWIFPWMESTAALLILAGVLVFMYPSTAAWFSQKEQSRVTGTAIESLGNAGEHEERERAEALAEAQEYNQALNSGAVYRSNENVVHSDTDQGTAGYKYEQLLNPGGNGFMGRLLYERLEIDLPIYHGTSMATLERGIGHLEGTSLPVGGTDTRSVLTAHRGLPEATLFTHLNDAKVGDTFSVSLMDQVLTYRVTEMVVIDPAETQSILPVEGEDMITLVTCTPLGINSHRILVNAVRVPPPPIGDEIAARQAPHLPGFPWWMVILGGTAVLCGLFIWQVGRSLARRHRRNSESSSGLE
ncbi:class C sortase [Glutamicibacter arilaitensis]|uniref:class C sortase n=1 Tax=Glutamicibacter arilaitensis TaxID=256701 RepID=UPI003FD23114